MIDQPAYHEGMRSLQDSRDTRAIADRLQQVTLRSAFRTARATSTRCK